MVFSSQDTPKAMAKEVARESGQVREERGIFHDILRFARCRRSGPAVTASQPSTKSAGHIQRLMNTMVITPCSAKARATGELGHGTAGDTAGGRGSQVSPRIEGLYPMTDRESVYSSTSGSGSRSTTETTEIDPPSGAHVSMISPYRGREALVDRDRTQPTIFSKEALISMDHGSHHLAIDLYRPEQAADDVFIDTIFPLQDLAPLCLNRQLRSLSVVGMMQSYQSYIWLVVWLNPHLTELTLEMARQGERLDVKAIEESGRYAESKPSMQEVTQGQGNATTPQKLPIVSLSLTNFLVDHTPFEWFCPDTMRHLHLHGCDTAGFRLPHEMRGRLRVTITG